MKTKIIQLIASLTCALMLMGGCSTTGLQQYATPANAQIASTMLCANTLMLAVSDAERANAANYLYSVAAAVRSLSGGKVPTADELSAAIKLFTPNGSKWVLLATNLTSIWGAIYPKLQGNSKLALQYLEAIASGAEDAARPFLGPQPYGTPIHAPTPGPRR